RNPVIAMRHRHRDVFVRHGNDAGIFAAAVSVQRERFDERSEVGPGIGEDIIDAAFGQTRPVGLCGNGVGLGVSHRSTSVLLAFPNWIWDFKADWGGTIKLKTGIR